MMKQFLAIEIGGTKLQIFVGDEQANILERWRFDVAPKFGGAGIRAQIENALPDILRAHNVAAVGVGYGGPVDWRTGKICCSHQIEGWADFPLGAWLHQQARRPVVIDNDANCGALGEALRGAGQGSNPVFYVTLGSGVGGGLVVDGKIFHGAKPGESEIGHVRLDRAGTIIEQRCSGWAVDHIVRAVTQQDPASKLARLAAGLEAGQARALAPALQENCSLAQKILAEVAEHLAFGLSHVTHLMHPQIIILGGGLSLLGEPLRAAVEAALRRFVMEAFGGGPAIALATLREDAVPVGALLLSCSAIGSGPGYDGQQQIPIK
ncbi:MAG TPA: ROK family protein [Verrucomicrobiae bacterium]|jgi:glucokinase